MKASQTPTIYAFIDSQNLNLGVQSLGWKLDFAQFRRYLKDKYGVKRAFLCIGYIARHQDLYTYLRQSGYTCIFKPTLEVIDGKKRQTKGNVDAELVLHTMIEFPNYTKAIIVSCDGDFHCLIKYLVNKQKILRLMVPNKKYSSLLRKFSRYITRIDLQRERLEKK
jgi:uncharacterized LabA/DUF88 family protein